MSALATALRKFISRVTRTFHGARATFAVTAARWRSTVATLGKKVRSLADRFGSLKLSKRVLANGEELTLLGKLEGKEFASMLRTARSLRAFEIAAETTLSPIARNAFCHLDDIASLHFPDVSIMKRAEYVSRWRDTMVAAKLIDQIERVASALALEKLIRADATTLKRTNSLLHKMARHKKLVFLGISLTVMTGVRILMLCRTLERYAINHSGCFMYTRDLTNGVRKCRIAGCTCPVPLADKIVRLDDNYDEQEGIRSAGSDQENDRDDRSTVAVTCDDADLWEKIRVRNNECAIGVKAGRAEPFCVHCDWDQTDPNSLDFVDKDRLQENAYVRCEKIDSLDALNETIGFMVDDAFGAGKAIANIAKESLASSASAAPWIIGSVAIFIILLVIIFVWRFGSQFAGGGSIPAVVAVAAPALQRDGEGNDGNDETPTTSTNVATSPTVPTTASTVNNRLPSTTFTATAHMTE